MSAADDAAALKGRIRELEEIGRAQDEEIRRLREENRRWARLAGTDPLTGLASKISFLRAIVPQALQRAAREGKPVGVLLMSADDLGDINEARGREAGDQVIKGLGEMLKSLLDEKDRIGHLDGTHFAVVLYPAGPEEVRARANMLRARVRGHSFPCGDAAAQITLSIGTLSFQPAEGEAEGNGVEDLFRSLNAAVYAAKRAGGNRVEVAQDRGRP